MTYLIDQLVRIRWWLLAVLIAAAPFHAFLTTWLKIPGFPMWREGLVVLICAIITSEIIVKKFSIRNFDLLDWLILGFALLGLLFLPFQLSRLSQWALGMRFDVMPFLFFVFLRRVEWRGKDALFRIALGSGAVVLIFGLLQTLVLPQDFLIKFGYSLQQGPFSLEQPISGCQYLEHTDSVCRATSSFASPMRYGSYLLLLIGLLVPFLIQKRSGPFVFLALALANLFLTYSRAAWIGALAMGAAGAVWAVMALRSTERGRRIVRNIFLFSASAAVLAGIALGVFISDAGGSEPGFLKTIFLRASSTGEHFTQMKWGAIRIFENPFGYGMGTAGPASLRFEKFVTENWYLQIGVEMGVLGMALFIAILWGFAKKFHQSWKGSKSEEPAGQGQIWINRGLFLALIGISAMGLFIHSFEETTTMLTFAAMAALYLKR